MNGWSKGAFETYADGFGVWHAAVPDWADEEVARRLILNELRQRDAVDPGRIGVRFDHIDAFGRRVYVEVLVDEDMLIEEVD